MRINKAGTNIFSRHIFYNCIWTNQAGGIPNHQNSFTFYSYISGIDFSSNNINNKSATEHQISITTLIQQCINESAIIQRFFDPNRIHLYVSPLLFTLQTVYDTDNGCINRCSIVRHRSCCHASNHINHLFSNPSPHGVYGNNGVSG
ncbi:hypothetical protein D3C85_1217330 [compost metagenome]